MTAPRWAAAATLALPVLLLAACANGNTPETTPTTPSPATAVPTSPAPTPGGDATGVPGEDPTCETIIPASNVADSEEVGWTAQAAEFRISGIKIPGAIPRRETR